MVLFNMSINNTAGSNIGRQWPKTLEEAVRITLSGMSDKYKKILKATRKKNLTMFHAVLGATIRNDFGLWNGNDELLISCGAHNPDDTSIVIIRAVWKALQDESNIRK